MLESLIRAKAVHSLSKCSKGYILVGSVLKSNSTKPLHPEKMGISHDNVVLC